MIAAVLFFWVVSAILVVLESRIVPLIIYTGVFSLLSAGCFLLFAAPDVAMAQAVVGVFSTIVFIVPFEKYVRLADVKRKETHTGQAMAKTPLWFSRALPLLYTAALAALFIAFIPDSSVSGYLKDQYTTMFQADVGGENAVTAIYLAYRVYDTLLEALMLLVSIVALIHLSWYGESMLFPGALSNIRDSAIAGTAIRFISPVLILFSAYLVMNGHISPGGGFQAGVVAASFFICKYFVHDIDAISMDKVITFEKLIYASLAFIAIAYCILGIGAGLPVLQTPYLMIMNLLICIKVACGFLVLFYRFIVVERS